MGLLRDSVGRSPGARTLTLRLLSGLVGAVAVFALLSFGCDKKAPTTYDDEPFPVAGDTQPNDTLIWDQNSIYIVQIETTRSTLQGMHERVDVNMNQWLAQVGGWDMLIGYDASALLFQAAIPGPLHAECRWEYFNYRYLPFGNGDTLCPSGMLRVVGIAETNNGPNHPDVVCCDSLGAAGPFALFTLDFLVSNDRTLECRFVPIRFFWMDCGDNSIAFHPLDNPMASIQGASRYVFETPGLTEMISDETTGYPTYTGVQRECFENDPGYPIPVAIIDFINGGVDIVCADSIDDRGDINLNGTANEISDAVLFSNYFVKGVGVFNVNYNGQVAASDVNANGTTLEVTDLVYLIRIITGDALPRPPLTPVPGKLTYSGGVLSIDVKTGAAYLVLAGEVAPRLLATRMEMNYAFDGRNTRLLVSKIGTEGFEGQFLAFDGDLVSFEMATYDGAPIDLDGPYDGDQQPVRSYPNPFSDTTTIRCITSYPVQYTCTIFDAVGAEVAMFSSGGAAEMITITWDATGLPAGPYVCRLEFAGIVLWHSMLKAN